MELTPTMTAVLAERYDVSTPVPRGLTERQLEVIWHRCGLYASRWCEAEGLECELNYWHGEDEAGEWSAGVWWDVVVGRGHRADAEPAAGAGQAALDWVWSSRWEHWAGWFGSLRARERAEQRLFAKGTPTVTRLSAHAATPPWERAARELADNEG